MRRGICILIVCCMILLNISAFALEMPVVSVKDGIEMSSISYNNLSDGNLEGNTQLTIAMTAAASEASDTKYVFVATLLGGGNVMKDIDSDTKVIGTEPTSFEVTLDLPEDVADCIITVSLLKITGTGLTPVSKASYCPSDSKFLKLVKVSADGMDIQFDNEFNASVSMAPRANSFPEVFEVQTADASTKVDLTIDDVFPGNAYAVASLPDGTEITYTMYFFAGKHTVTNALEDTSFGDAHKKSNFPGNKISKEDVLYSALFEGKDDYISYDASYDDFCQKLFTNLSGIDEENGNYFGSRWVTDYDSHQVHSVNYVHPELEGYDYFITRNGDMAADTGFAHFDFDLSYDAEVIIVAYNKCGSYPTQGWTESYNGDGFIRTSAFDYDNSKLIDEIGYDVTYSEAKAWDEKVDDMAYFSFLDGGNEAYETACEALASSITERHGRLVTKEDLYGLEGKLMGDEYTYRYTYSKEFIIPEGEETCNVKIYGPDTNQKRGFVVVVKPIVDESASEPAKAPQLKAIEIDGMAIADFDPDIYNYTYKIDPRDGTLPEIKGIGIGTGLEISTDNAIATDGKSATCTITVTGASGLETYTVDMNLDEYVPAFIADDYNIVDLKEVTLKNYTTGGNFVPSYDNDNANAPQWIQCSSASVASSFNKTFTYGTVFTNLSGPENMRNPNHSCSPWITDYFYYYMGSNQAFGIFDVDDSLKGSQYFPFYYASRNVNSDTDILVFDVTKPCKVSILSTKSGCDFEGYTRESGKSYVDATYTVSSIRPCILNADENDPYIESTDIPFGMFWDAYTSNPDSLTWDEYYDRYFNGKSKKTSEELFDYFSGKGFKFDGVSNAGTVVTYNYAYTKTFLPGDTVVIPKDNNNVKQDRTFLVVVSPYEEIADTISE